MKKTIYIPTPLTPDVVEKLEDKMYYSVFDRFKQIDLYHRGTHIKINYSDFDFILFPIEVSEEMIKEQTDKWFGWIEKRINPQYSRADKDYIKFGMKEFLKDFLSSLKAGGK